jgi:hypothetical protein
MLATSKKGREKTTTYLDAGVKIIANRISYVEQHPETRADMNKGIHAESG